MDFDTSFEVFFSPMHKILPSVIGCLGHSSEPSIVVSLVVSKVHMENIAERNAYFIRLKSFVFGHTDNNNGVFEAIFIDNVSILNKELLRI